MNFMNSSCTIPHQGTYDSEVRSDGGGKNGIQAREIGRRIQQARKEAGGMSQRELADLLGVTERSISAYENGEVVPYRFLGSSRIPGEAEGLVPYGDDGLKPSAIEERQDEILRKLEEILGILRT